MGEFKKYHKNSIAAETYALVNALTIAKENISEWGRSEVVIYHEIEYALKPIRNKFGEIRERDKDRADAITEIAIPILEQTKRWRKEDVKAHYRNWNEHEKYILNRWCDKNSRKELKEIRKKVLAFV